MASHRLNPLYAIKECSTCGSLYTKECCSIGSFEDKILTPVPDSSPRCARCGTPVDGPSCRGCAFLRKKFDEDLLTYCVENGIFQDFQNTSESSDDNTNVVNALREPCVVNQDPGVKFSQEPPQIDHNCCYECGDSLDGIFCRQCICKSCGKGAHYGYNCPPKDPIISKPEPCNQTINEIPQTLPSLDPSCYSLPHVSKPNFVDNSPNFSYPPPQPQFETYLCELCGNNAHYGYDCSPQFPFVYEQEPCYNQNFNDNYYPQNSPSFSQQYLCCAYCGGDIIARNSMSKAITPDLSIEEPNNSLNMGDEHLDTISATESDEEIKSSVENLVPIPSEFEGIFDDTCDVPVCDDSSTFDALNDNSEILSDSNNDGTSSDDDDFEDVEYEEVNDVDQEEKEFDLEDILKIQDVILREKLLNVHRLISNIESLKVNPTLDRVLKSPSPFPIPVVDSDSFLEESDTSFSHLGNSLPEFESFSDHTEETRSGSTSTHANYSLPEYDSFLF
ncbi:hypothetical protein Tco_0951646 [Tanacetum coccineum]|uniref:CCHC-type domain-containing protein n=1 Tax=Tanacetum coccineum TaxID=301880 RepID=A0ABQ5DXI8_9ASTR